MQNNQKAAKNDEQRDLLRSTHIIDRSGYLAALCNFWGLAHPHYTVS